MSHTLCSDPFIIFLCGCDGYVVVLFVLIFPVKSVFLDGFCSGGEKVSGWIAEGLGVA